MLLCRNTPQLLSPSSPQRWPGIINVCYGLTWQTAEQHISAKSPSHPWRDGEGNGRKNPARIIDWNKARILCKKRGRVNNNNKRIRTYKTSGAKSNHSLPAKLCPTSFEEVLLTIFFSILYTEYLDIWYGISLGAVGGQLSWLYPLLTYSAPPARSLVAWCEKQERSWVSVSAAQRGLKHPYQCYSHPNSKTQYSITDTRKKISSVPAQTGTCKTFCLMFLRAVVYCSASYSKYKL